jgi:hypothetical protein
MSRPAGRAVFWAAAVLVVVSMADGAAARGGGGRGGAGFSRGGPAARGSFAQNRAAGGMDRGAYNARGPAADGSFGTEHPGLGDRQEQRQERREERQDQRAERREDWQEYAEDHDEYYDDSYYGAPGAEAVGAVVEPLYYTLPCTPVVMAMGGVVYYVCGSDWYIRAYSDGDVVYTLVPRPTGQ